MMTPTLGYFPTLKRRRRGVTSSTCCFRIPQEVIRLTIDREIRRNSLLRSVSSNLAWSMIVNLVTVLLTVRDFALFTKTCVGVVPHYRKLK